MLRKDQVVILKELAEKLADVFIQEADPSNWTAAGIPMSDMTQEERGNRHWDRKGAMGTGGVLKFAMEVATRAEDNAMGRTYDDEADLDAQVQQAQKRAKAAMLKIVDGGQRTKFIEKATHARKG